MARTSECLTCDRVFTPRPMHPMIESAWCDACLAILRPVWREQWVPIFDEPATRATLCTEVA